MDNQEADIQHLTALKRYRVALMRTDTAPDINWPELSRYRELSLFDLEWSASFLRVKHQSLRSHSANLFGHILHILQHLPRFRLSISIIEALTIG